MADQVQDNSRVEELEHWIEIAGGIKCPNCDDSGCKPGPDGYGNCIAVRCQFCEECPDSIFNKRKEKIK